MKANSGVAIGCLWLGMLLAILYLLGPRVVCLAAGFSALWFTISFVLLSRPPAIPEFVSERPGSDEQYVIRRDVMPQVPLPDRFRWSLTVACGSCLLLWLTLSLLAR